MMECHVLFLGKYMIKNILWDFDGVILDSMKIKGDGFLELFKEYESNKVKLLEEYHYKHGGVSRFAKVKYFFNEILDQEISEDRVIELSQEFGNIIEKKLYNQENLIKETLDYIQQNHTKYNFHIVSGAEHNELNALCEFFNLSNYFITIKGSPTKKDILVKNIMDEFNCEPKETVLIGDAITDYNAAVINKIEFYGYNNSNLKKYNNYIESFKEFSL